MNILFLLPTFGYSSAARQVSVLAPELRRSGLDVHLATLGQAGPLAADFDVHSLGDRPDMRPTNLWRLRKLIRHLRPDVIHAWRLPAIRTAALVLRTLRKGPRLAISEVNHNCRLTAFDERLIRGAVRVELPLAVSPPLAAPSFERPPNSRIVMCAGNLTADHGFRDAIWAFDMLKYVVPDLHLFIVGDGPERGRLGEFARRVGHDDVRVYFVAARPDVPSLLQHAAVVWVPSRTDCGRQVLREAQAAARPVIATRVPRLDSLIADGKTGLLVPPGDPVALATATRRLLDNAALADRLSAADRAAVADATPERIAQNWRAICLNEASIH